MRVLQINSVCGYGSTGRIVTDLADIAIEQGHICMIGYGRRSVPEAYRAMSVRIGSDWDSRRHALRTRLLDGHGFGSRRATDFFLSQVRSYDPDVIHLHNIHGYYINIEELFSYLKQVGKPVVWTLHDCWAFTGHCAHYSAVGCERWKVQCHDCPQRKEYPGSFCRDGSRDNYLRKKELFTGLSDLTLVTPSHWLADQVRMSFLKDYPVKVIPNGIDLDVFKPTASRFREEHGFQEKIILLGVANIWNERKGLCDFAALSKLLDAHYQIVLVGLNDAQRKDMPSNILALPRTGSAEELAAIYSAADVFLNPSVEETMGMTTVEALACGTPAVVYDRTAVPEVVDETCGIVVEPSPEALRRALDKCSFLPAACRARAMAFEKRARYMDYLGLYTAGL